MLITGWLVLGVPMAFKKAKMAQKLQWVGVVIHAMAPSQTVLLEVPEEKLDELRHITLDFGRHNVLKKKAVRTYVGKLEAIASVLYTLRPFLREFFLGGHYQKGTGAPHNCIWRAQVELGLLWMKAFLELCTEGPLQRRFTVLQHLNQGDAIIIMTDASPWSMGAVIFVNGVPWEFFAIRITSHDQLTLGVDAGDSTGQQAWESLALLISL